MLNSSPVHNKRRHRKAFSFFELIVVLIIIGIMSAVAVPRLSGSMARIQLESAKRRVELDIAHTQHRARFTGLEQKLKFKVTDSSYLIVGMNDPDHAGRIYTVELDQEPYNTTITAANFGGIATLKYDGFGQPKDPGYVTLQVGSKSVNVLVSKDGMFDIPVAPILIVK